MEIIRQKDAQKAAGARLSDLIESYGDAPILLLLSGGSSLAVLSYCTVPLEAAHLFISVVDERFSDRLADQNFAAIKDTKFYIAARLQGANPLDLTLTSSPSAEVLAQGFEKSLHDWVTMYPKGKIIAVLGVGKDGHVAGLIPPLAAEEVQDTRWAIAHKVPHEVNPHTDRVTVTFDFLLHNVDAAVAFMTGEEKRPVLLSLAASAVKEKQAFPAQILKEMRAVSLFTDILDQVESEKHER